VAQALVASLDPVCLELGDPPALTATRRRMQTDTFPWASATSRSGSSSERSRSSKAWAVAVALRDRAEQLFFVFAGRFRGLEGDTGQQVLVCRVGHHLGGGTMAEAPGRQYEALRARPAADDQSAVIPVDDR
jgi:hypothetical protein